MRRDVCYFFSADVVSVYNSYMTAATNSRFRRNCNQEPYHTISFGLNFSMKYNMNGGACTIHFIPYHGGTAVDLRFSVAQVAGARYEKYAKDLTSAAMDVLGVPAQLFSLNIDEFLKESRGRRLIRAIYDEGKVYLPKGGHSSGMLGSMIGCNCLIDIKPGTPKLDKGDKVQVVIL